MHQSELKEITDIQIYEEYHRRKLNSLPAKTIFEWTKENGFTYFSTYGRMSMFINDTVEGCPSLFFWSIDSENNGDVHAGDESTVIKSVEEYKELYFKKNGKEFISYNK